MPATIHPDFEHVRMQWLRRRFLWYAGVLIVLGIARNAAVLATWLAPHGETHTTIVRVAPAIAVANIGFVIVAIAFVFVYRRALPRTQLIRLVQWMIFLPCLVAAIAAIPGTDSAI